MTAEPRVRRQAVPRPELVELAERVARLEATGEHLQETLNRIDVTLSKMQQKIETLAAGMAQGIGGLRVGAVLGQVVAGVVGFVAAHLWPLSK